MFTPVAGQRIQAAWEAKQESPLRTVFQGGCYRMSSKHAGFIQFFVARQEGFEPPTHGLEGRCSIQLSYWRRVFYAWLM